MPAKILVLSDASALNTNNVKDLLALATGAENVNHLAMVKEGLKAAGVTVDETEGKLVFKQDDEIVTLLFSQSGTIRGVEIKEAGKHPFVVTDPEEPDEDPSEPTDPPVATA